MTLHSLHRSHNARRGFGVWATLAFGLKALIPTGFMIAPVDGHARLVMCPAGVYQAALMHHAVGMNHAPGMNHASGMHRAQGMHPIEHAAHAALAAGQCPFALAGGPGLPGTAHELPEPYFAWVQLAPALAPESIPAPPPWRFHAPRGPPSHA